MSPATGIAASQLRQLIFYHLDNELSDNATFLAGRLYALEPRNPDSSHLLALTNLRQRRWKLAYDSAQKYGSGGRHLGCAYIFAQACLELGKYLEGTAALEKSKSLWQNRNNWNKHSETTRRHTPDAAAVQTLLARLWRNYGDTKKAGDCYVEAHKANPFIWETLEGLCKIGADVDLEKMFRQTTEMGSASKTSNMAEIYTDQPKAISNALSQQNNFTHANGLTPSNDPFSTRSSGEQEGVVFALPKARSRTALTNGLKAPLSEWDTPTANSNGTSFEDDVDMEGLGGGVNQDQPPLAPSRRARAGQQVEPSERLRHPALRGQQTTSSDPQDSAVPTEAGIRKTSGGHKRTISGHASQSSIAAPDSAAPRRSNRLFGQSTTSTTTRSGRTTAEPPATVTTRSERESRPARTATGAKGRTTGTVGRVVSGNRKMMPPDPTEKEKEKEKERERLRRAPSRNSEKPPAAQALAATTTAKPPPAVIAEQEAKEAISGLLKSFRQLAVGYRAASRYDLTTAIETFNSLSSTQRETPWVLAQLAKAYYEAADYRAAENCFIRLLKLQPSRIEDMEVYSTVLWHLKKEAPLAFLCHSLREQAFDTPETWCAVGNSFSLAREHDQAIAAFKRAIQIDESFAYAWTLMGHEYIANEEFDAALSSFRKSVTADKRSYAGWYGLGRSLERMGKLEDAERHYRIAAQINPSNATLMVCIGVIFEKLRKKPNALDCYSRALELAPQSALARFKKSRVLMHMREFELALRELLVLRDLAPDEANVWFLLGKCWKGLGEKGEALRAFTTALNLDVKVSFDNLPLFFMTSELTIQFHRLPPSSRKQWRAWTMTRKWTAMMTSQSFGSGKIVFPTEHSVTVLRFSIGKHGSMGEHGYAFFINPCFLAMPLILPHL
jgi:anaphase-promoting complex subunit 3